MEFPGIFLINRAEPFIFGMPFIYGFTVIMWVLMCVVMFIGYKTNWGKGADFRGKED
jgi:cellobiose-specific phosphotransferase system component IIC